MPRVVHFEMGFPEPEKAAEFYQSVFGWNINKWDGGGEDYWLVGTGEKGTPGINGSFFRTDDWRPPTVNTVDVEDLNASLEMVKKAGGELIGEIQPIPGVGTFCYCKDSQGVLFGIMQDEPGSGM